MTECLQSVNSIKWIEVGLIELKLGWIQKAALGKKWNEVNLINQIEFAEMNFNSANAG